MILFFSPSLLLSSPTPASFHLHVVCCSGASSDASSVRIMSYNLLAASLAAQFRHELYAPVPNHCLQWRARCAKIVREIGALDCDIVALQVR